MHDAAGAVLNINDFRDFLLCIAFLYLFVCLLLVFAELISAMIFIIILDEVL